MQPTVREKYSHGASGLLASKGTAPHSSGQQSSNQECIQSTKGHKTMSSCALKSKENFGVLLPRCPISPSVLQPRIWLTSNWIKQRLYQIPIHSEMPVHLKWIIFVCVCLVTQSCLTLCDPLACSLPGSFVQGILQVRIREGVVIPFSRGSSQPRDRIQVSYIAGRFFTNWATRESTAC